jgi:hypothetical protein
MADMWRRVVRFYQSGVFVQTETIISMIMLIMIASMIIIKQFRALAITWNNGEEDSFIYHCHVSYLWKEEHQRSVGLPQLDWVIHGIYSFQQSSLHRVDCSIFDLPVLLGF